METSIWFEIVKLLLPSLAVLAASYMAIKLFLDRETQKQKLDLKIANRKIITPLRLQAYERLVLLMERISPENLLVRVYQPGMSAQEYHQALLLTIRSEFEHNLSQQIYVSDEAWEAVKAAKESILKLINLAATSERGKENAKEISRIVLEAYSSVEESPVDAAIKLLKQEIREQLY